jgi:Carboxypeptidase regulatory-like domain
MRVLHLRNSMTILLLFALARPQGVPEKNVPSSFGAVQGRVIDELGKPLADARVYAESVDGRDATGKLRFVTTKEDGDFMLEQVAPGMNVICASKEEAFYPDTGAAALATDLSALPRVQVQEGKLTRGVTVRLTKGGKLIGSILDSINSEPVKNSRIRLSRTDDPSLYISTGPDEEARFEFVVPSKTFRLQVTALGYKAWNSDDHGGAILVQPEFTKEFTIRLEAD